MTAQNISKRIEVCNVSIPSLNTDYTLHYTTLPEERESRKNVTIFNNTRHRANCFNQKYT